MGSSQLSQDTLNLQKFMAEYPHAQELNLEQARAKYQEFIDVISDHNHLYYIDAKPIISDVEYDQLFSYLKQIEEYFPQLISSNSPTQALIGQLSEGFKKAEHRFPLLSLENSYSLADIKAWAQRGIKIAEKAGCKNRKYLLEPKFDWLSVEIVYQNGEFVQAITRWDGKIWEDITQNVKTIRSLPKQIPYSGVLRVRGEIMMGKKQLSELNQQREKSGLSPFANTRNAAAGSIKLLDSAEVARRNLVCFVYDILEWDQHLILKELWLPVFELPFRVNDPQNIDEIWALTQDFQLKQYLDEQDYDFDGLVIKMTDEEQVYREQTSEMGLFWSDFSDTWKVASQLGIREVLGATEHHPRRAIAYKFPAQQVASQIQSVDFQVGRTGIITPVANIQPVQLSGVQISRVSLHNFDFIQNKQIKKWDFVRVQRSWEVIPYIVWVIKERRDGTEDFIRPPLFCPACNWPISNIDIHYYCTNPACPAQIKEKIVHFVSRDAMDIWGIWDSMVEVLVQQGILRSVSDIYALEKIENQILLRKFPNFWEKKIAELAGQLELSKRKPLWRLLNALGIPNVGKKIAQDLAEYLLSKKVQRLSDIPNILWDKEGLSELYGVWGKIIEGLQLYFSNPENLKVLSIFESVGIKPISEEKVMGSIWWSHFSLTGSFPMSRGVLIKHLQDKGYQYDENPLQTTNFMLIGEKPGSKAEKAKKIWLEIFDSWEEIVAKFGLEFSESQQPKKVIQQWGLF